MDTPSESWEGRSADAWRKEWNAGWTRFYASAGSTNDIAAQLAASGAPNLSVVVADEQTRGRGRGGNAWLAPAGSSLLFSLILHVDENGTAPGCAPIRVGMAVARAIGGAMVKWPNDVVMPGHGKVAGILCEGSFTSAGGYIVAGIGINVRQRADRLEPNACSLLTATGREVSRADLLGSVMREMHGIAGRLMDPLSDAEVDVVNQLDVLLGKDVICEAGSEVISGRALGVTRTGSLRVGTGEGEMREILNGTIRLANNEYPGK